MVSFRLPVPWKSSVGNNERVEANRSSESEVRRIFEGNLVLPWMRAKIPPAPVEPSPQSSKMKDRQRIEFRELYKTIYYNSDESLYIKVGTGIHATRWIIRKGIICHYSEYFNSACRSGMAEAQSNRFVLSDDDPLAFSLFVEWMHTWEKPAHLRPNDNKYIWKWNKSPTPWCQNAHLAWILADKLLAPEFSRYALSNFIRHAVCIRNEKVFRFIDDNTLETSALASFAFEWEHRWEWNRSGTVSGIDGAPRDPRGYGVDHWYECGRMGGCIHHSSVVPVPHPPNRRTDFFPSWAFSSLYNSFLAFVWLVHWPFRQWKT